MKRHKIRNKERKTKIQGTGEIKKRKKTNKGRKNERNNRNANEQRNKERNKITTEKPN